ncbi:MAG TPA: TlyA family RNA methyltransferase [Blastocatellia bacterium]|nr:TlyA family RNA methyltransferase [Blastocatellia bacterium]
MSKRPKQRLDKLLVERGFAETRAKAQAMILAGQVLVNEQKAEKPGQSFDSASQLRIKGEPSRYVSRGGLKLEAALARFNVDPSGKTCIDIGASTGGFTDCLLQHGAKQVWAVDVGHNQLAWRIRQDPRVEVIEGMNARDLDQKRFPVKFELATIDVSFISLAKILPSVRQVLSDSGEVVALIKPQFEVGKGEVGRGGIVSDPAKQKRVIQEVVEGAVAFGLWATGVTESPIRGGGGNREFFVHLVRTPQDSSTAQIELHISELLSR